MSKLRIAINLSLDGFADHTVATADAELHDFFGGLLDDTDVALFGRETYLLMESYWPRAHEDPTADAAELRFADTFNALPKIVFSRTLQSATWNNTTLSAGDALEEVARLKRAPGRYISVGGVRFAREFIRRGMIDEFWLVIHPVLVGSGVRLFEGLNREIRLKLIESRPFRSGAVALRYVAGS